MRVGYRNDGCKEEAWKAILYPVQTDRAGPTRETCEPSSVQLRRIGIHLIEEDAVFIKNLSL